MKVFISQPMAYYADNVIEQVREHICELFSIKNEDLIDSFVKTVPEGIKNNSVWCLGDSIRLMATADLVIFAPGWEEARGCLMEHDICTLYEIPFIEMESSRKTKNKVRDCQFYSKLSSSR